MGDTEAISITAFKSRKAGVALFVTIFPWLSSAYEQAGKLMMGSALAKTQNYINQQCNEVKGHSFKQTKWALHEEEKILICIFTYFLTRSCKKVHDS